MPRLFLKGVSNLQSILSAIFERIPTGRYSDRPFLIAIDGRSASGKSTLSLAIQERIGCPVIQMDQFFLRPEQRVPSRYEMPGGNVDHERFLAEVLLPLQKGIPFSYQPFNCHSMDFDPPILVENNGVCVVEGSYSCHPLLRKHYDLRIFLTISPEEQRRRILSRNGPEQAEMFFSRWIPLEERYFDAFDVQSTCQLCFEY